MLAATAVLSPAVGRAWELNLRCDGGLGGLRELARTNTSSQRCFYTEGVSEVSVRLSCRFEKADLESKWSTGGSLFSRSRPASMAIPKNGEDLMILRLNDVPDSYKERALREISVFIGIKDSLLVGSPLRCLDKVWKEITKSRVLIDSAFESGEILNLAKVGETLELVVKTCRSIRKLESFAYTDEYDGTIREIMTTVGAHLASLEQIFENGESSAPEQWVEARSCVMKSTEPQADGSSAGRESIPLPPSLVAERVIKVDAVSVLGKKQGWGDQIMINRQGEHVIPLEVFLDKKILGEPSDGRLVWGGREYDFARHQMTFVGAFSGLSGTWGSMYQQPWRYCYYPEGMGHSHERDHNLKTGIRYFPEVRYDARTDRFEIHLITNGHEQDVLHWLYIPGEQSEKPYLLFEIAGLSQREIEDCSGGELELYAQAADSPPIEWLVREATKKEIARHTARSTRKHLYMVLKPSLGDLRFVLRRLGGRAKYHVKCATRPQPEPKPDVPSPAPPSPISPWQKWSFLGFGSFSGLSSPRRPGLRMSAGWTQIAVFGSSGRQEGRIWPVGSRKGRPRGPGGPARLAVCRLRNACA